MNKEMYDYLSVVTPDYSATTLSLRPQKTLTEEGEKNVIIHQAEDNSEERIVFSSDSIFYVTLSWDILTESDAGTIVDFYHDSAKANGMARTFKWAHPTDGHTYVVRFDSKLSRNFVTGKIHGITSVKFKVLGKIADA